MVDAKYATGFPPQVLQDNEQIIRTSQKNKKNKNNNNHINKLQRQTYTANNDYLWELLNRP